MFAQVLVSLLASVYGAVRGLLSLAVKAFFVYGALVLVMAWAADRASDAFSAYAPWFGYSLAVVAVRGLLDALYQRGLAFIARA
jgi:hypothetical protein